ncbi:hypothetical protein [Dyella sp.]|uniref:hypothetical protein n=1 Tax=Dyella sp. TaxID=1869338 RepID=UPI002FD9E14F
MTKQFAYQDAHGHVYPAHAALAFQPGLVPGWYDTDKRTFTPNGNPQEQTGSIITDANFGGGKEQVLSGLRDDRGAGTAPIQSGVAFTSPHDAEEAAEVATRLSQAQAELEALRQQNAVLQAQNEVLQGVKAESTPLPYAPLSTAPDESSTPPAGDESGELQTPVADLQHENDPPDAEAPVKRARKVNK